MRRWKEKYVEIGRKMKLTEINEGVKTIIWKQIWKEKKSWKEMILRMCQGGKLSKRK